MKVFIFSDLPLPLLNITQRNGSQSVVPGPAMSASPGNLLKAHFGGFPCGSAGKESGCNAGDLGSIPGLGSSPGEGNGHPLQYSGLENPTDCIVHGVAESDMTERLSLSPNLGCLARVY